MGKKKKHRAINLMKDWPSDGGTIHYESLIHPVKKVFFEGYKLERKAIKQFTYTGYNIGNSEHLYYPTPSERFSSKWLENEEKHNRTLLDNIFVTIFQLGMEYGRRSDRSNKLSNDLLHDILRARTATIKELREKLSVYDPAFAEPEPIPVETENLDLLIETASDNVDAQNSKED